ncbi:MAG: amidophosphoribosyltransferase [Methanophagales archaeon ANME-1-THS]|nr:MAG: amidophosphoribosyltransferase [Methanophagales archaeon ANME-1-THS]
MSACRGALSKREGCGIAGIALPHGNAASPLFYALYALQHRGQESAGIAVSSSLDGGVENERGGMKRDITLKKGMGLVYQVFSSQHLESLNGNIGIGHVRYSTTGASRIENAEPLLVNYRKGKIAIAHNGNLVNAMDLRRELEREGRIFHSDTDTEVIAQLLAKELMRHDPIAALKEVMKRVIGSYSLTILLNNTLIAVRDPLGIKPLCIGTLNEGNGGMNAGYAIASESTAIETLGGNFIRDVEPGEVLMINPQQNLPRFRAEHPEAEGMDIEQYQVYRCVNSAHCVFEYIYFARPDSVLDGRLVYDVRMKIGERLAEEDDIEADIVSPVPDSGITFAIGYAKRAGIDYLEGLIKNRYVGRTFIMPEQTSRDISVRLKLSVVQTNVVGKRIILVDDSIVRGTTSRIIVDYLKKKGAKEVHLRIGSPPIIAPCYLGIDTPTRKELVAWKRAIDEIGRLLHADSLRYLSLEGLIEAVGIDEKNLCLGCLTENYPVEIPGEVCIARQLKLTHF